MVYYFMQICLNQSKTFWEKCNAVARGKKRKNDSLVKVLSHFKF